MKNGLAVPELPGGEVPARKWGFGRNCQEVNGPPGQRDLRFLRVWEGLPSRSKVSVRHGSKNSLNKRKRGTSTPGMDDKEYLCFMRET